ncbi:MAG: LuxR C-terminal-related transcriptional regulator [Rhodospirillaceae bacterium]
MSRIQNFDGSAFLEAIERINAATTYAELHQCMETVPARYGLTMLNCWKGNLATWMPLDVPVDWDVLCEDPVVMKNRKIPISLYMSTEIMGWKQHYLEQEFVNVDPVFWTTLFIDRPFYWDHRFRSTIVRKEQKDFMTIARKWGIQAGWVKPFHGKALEVGAMAYFAPPEEKGLAEKLTYFGSAALDLFSKAFFEKLNWFIPTDSNPENKIKLTLRECECLRYSAVGKTSLEIAKTLGVTERTVNYHLTNAMQKLGVHSKAHAIAKFMSNINISYNS